jgi:hypothetical protein
MDFTLLALLYGFCPECRDPLMFWVGQFMGDREGLVICVDCPKEVE